MQPVRAVKPDTNGSAFMLEAEKSARPGRPDRAGVAVAGEGAQAVAARQPAPSPPSNCSPRLAL